MRVAQQLLSILGSVVLLVVLVCPAPLTMASSASAARLKVIDASATESGPALRFRVRLIGHTERPVRVSYSTVSGSARAGSDFSTVMGQLGFLPETRKRTIVVNVLPDTIVEGRETFSVKLWKPIGASIARGHATGTIRDDDTPPAIGSAGTPRGPPSAAAPKVVINELLPDPRGVAADQEFVELLNASPSPVDLDGWTLDANGDCALAGVLPPGGLHVVSDDPLIRDSACAPSLPGTGGTVTLRDGPPGSGAVIDSLDYAGFPIALGESIGLDPTKADPAENDLASSWCSAFASGAVLYGPSENLGTPGSANGSCKH